MNADGVGWSTDTRALARAYLLAKQQVIASGFEREIAWQEAVTLESVTAETFVREAAWVVLCAGMRESVVRSRFDRLGCAFSQWDPEIIASNADHCRRQAVRIFNHAAKLDAIVEIAGEVASAGVQFMIGGLKRDGPTFLMRLPYIGPTTCFHLAKNLGCSVAKPDRHLERMAAVLGYTGAPSLCTAIAKLLGEPIQVVDIVMWRYATIDRHYVSWLHGYVTGAPRSPTPGKPLREVVS